MAALHLTIVACILVCLRCYGSFTHDECRMYICHLFVSGIMAALHLTTIVCILFVSGVMAALHLTTIACILVCLRYYGSFTPDDYCMYTCFSQVWWQFYNCCMYTCLSQVLWHLYTWRLLICILVCLMCYGSFTPDDYCMYTCLSLVLWQLYTWRLLYVYLFVSSVMAALHLMTVVCILVCLRCYGSFTPDDYCMYTCLSQVLWQLYIWQLLCVYLFVSDVMAAFYLTTIVCI